MDDALDQAPLKYIYAQFHVTGVHVDHGIVAHTELSFIVVNIILDQDVQLACIFQ
jgi:hypothetical protein